MLSPLSQQIATDLAALGIRPGDVLLVHSSLKSLGHADCTPQTVIEGLLEALGEKGETGTLLLPALSYATVGPMQKNLTFDLLNTPSCVGAIPEWFRTSFPGVRRSVHPTHSVCAVGARAAEMIADHHLDTTPCGPHSAFHRLPLVGGKLLMLGCGLRPNTSMHAIEELAQPPRFLGQLIEYQIILKGRSRTTMRVQRHSFVNQNLHQCYDRLGPLMAEPDVRMGKVLAAEAFLFDAKAMWRAALEALSRDGFYFAQPAPPPATK
jgi:aminoglycoside 3-N-acetyltransferase